MSESFNTSEKYLSQVPAMLALIGMGYRCLSQEEAEKMRGGLRRVLLESVLAEQILKLNKFTYRGTEHKFSTGDAEEAVRKLKPSPIEQRGLVRTNQDIYDQLLLGTTIEKTIDGDRKSYSIRYIDWDNPANNVYHATVEASVERTGANTTRRCDIILFVNGIPFAVIENKAPTESVQQAITQQIGYQAHDNIPHLYHYLQILIATNKNEAFYGTVGTSKKYWLTWKDEEDQDADIHAAINKPLKAEDKAKLFSGDFADAKKYFDALAAEGKRAVTAQDRTLYALCRPERLLEMVRIFTVFDGGVRKLARYQQFFGVRQTLRRLREFDHDGKRRGGVIWHTQGSGKSLTMVMLGRALALASDIQNARIIIATDRDDLDRQIKDTFKSCEMEPARSTSGTNLIELLEQKKSLITTIINKFDTATRTRDFVDNDPNIFVLVDESHRTQYGSFAAKMRRILPKACYIGFTGTPLLKEEKSTLEKFGGIIGKPYTIKDAVEDGAVVPLLYEGRYIEQNLSGTVIDDWFERVSKGLTDEQKADLKKKFSRMAMLSKTEQAIYAKALDISEHYRQTWQNTGRKGQIVAPSKAAAIRMKDILDEIGHVTSEVIISPPDDRESDDVVDMTSKNRIQTFWDDMMRKYGSEEEYNRQIIENFKSANDPELLIVVSKLLTGFDAPRNTILYVCKPLKEHNLLQAIARVNRLFEENEKSKQFGYIIDYEGLLGELDKALTTYSSFEGYDPEDVEGVLSDIREQIQKLPQLHQNLWDIFKEVANKLDHEQLEQHLADDAVRDEFYIRLREFSRCLHMALSSEKTYDIYSREEIEKFKGDWKRFSNLKRSVQIRYQEIVDIKEFEPKIQKLLDDHIIATPAQIVVEEVNINDPEALDKIISENNVTAASKADRIASATKKTITENMDIDPALYMSFSKMLEDTIQAYRLKRISETEYLSKVKDIANDVSKGRREDVPASITDNIDAQAFYGALWPIVSAKTGTGENSQKTAAQIALDILQIIQSPNHFIVHLWQNLDAQKKLQNAIDDYFFDVVEPTFGLKLDAKELDEIEKNIMNIARARFPL
ncbi:MAG: type I restriction endonuclease subunit R [Steroidobacteraceae bacterium]